MTTGKELRVDGFNSLHVVVGGSGATGQVIVQFTRFHAVTAILQGVDHGSQVR